MVLPRSTYRDEFTEVSPEKITKFGIYWRYVPRIKIQRGFASIYGMLHIISEKLRKLTCAYLEEYINKIWEKNKLREKNMETMELWEKLSDRNNPNMAPHGFGNQETRFTVVSNEYPPEPYHRCENVSSATLLEACEWPCTSNLPSSPDLILEKVTENMAAIIRADHICGVPGALHIWITVLYQRTGRVKSYIYTKKT